MLPPEALCYHGAVMTTETIAATAKKIFTYEEALATFPDVQQRTEAAVRQMEALVNQLKSRDDLQARQAELEEACLGIF